MANNDGVVYTKRWVVELILDLAGYKSDKPLWTLEAVEPSCGEGSFLEVMAERVADSAKRHNAFKTENLLNCVRSFDLDVKSVERSRDAVSAILCKAGLPAEDANKIALHWVRCEDYLLSETRQADFVVGNPPYVRAADLNNKQRKEYCQRFETMTMGSDIYVAFIERGLSELREDGKLCYICADRWLQNKYGSSLRRLVSEKYHIDAAIKMHDVDAFESQVSAYPAITLLGRGNGDVKYVNCNAVFNEDDVKGVLDWLESDCVDFSCPSFEAGLIPAPQEADALALTTPQTTRDVLRLTKEFPKLEDSGVNLGIGLATGRDAVFITDQEELVESSRMLPVFNMRDWRRGRRDKKRWLVNPWNTDGTLIRLEDYPRTQAYFESNRESLAKRHVAKKNSDSWYRTIDKPKWELLGKPMLLFPDMAGKSEPVYSDGAKYPCHNCYWITSDNWDLKVLGGLLMSETAEAFIDALGVKMRGGTLRFQAQYLRLIHVPRYEDLTEDVKAELRNAFERDDRMAATRAARLAYGLQEAE